MGRHLLLALRELAHQHPTASLAVGCLLIVMVLVRFARRGSTVRDPQRLFTTAQRREGNARAQGRCENARIWVLGRCGRPAEHGDHWYPHSRGGATTMENYVALCAPCNLSKSAKVPSHLATAALARRRRSYFPPGIPRRPGAKYQGELPR